MKATRVISGRGVLTLPARLGGRVGLRPEEPVIAAATADGSLPPTAVTRPPGIHSEHRVRVFDAVDAVLDPLRATQREAEA